MPAKLVIERFEILFQFSNGGIDGSLGKRLLTGHSKGAKCVICGMDIHPDIDYTCHGDPSLYVVSPVCFGSAL